MVSTRYFFILILLLVFVVSCKEKPQPTKIDGYTTYEDPAYRYSIKYPSNWKTTIFTKRLTSYSIVSEAKRFENFDSEGLPAAKIDYLISPLDSLIPLTKILENNQKFPPQYYTAPEALTIDGVKAMKTKYEFELEDGFFKGEMYVALKDSFTVNLIIFETFGDAMDTYRKDFDDIIKNVKIGVKPTRKAGDTVLLLEDLPFPTETLTAKDGEGYSISIPDNFRAETPKNNSNLYAKMYSGDRRGDSYILVEVIDASKQKNLKKIVETSAGSIPNAKTEQVKLAGVDAYIVSYNATSKIARKMYYMVKGDKLYRITMDYFIPEKDNYLPIFEKSVATFKLK